MLTPFQIPSFGGLDLREEPEEGGPQSAIDLLNVDFDRAGAVRTRDGASQFNGTAGASAFRALDVWSLGNSTAPIVIASDTGNALRAYSGDGTTLIASLAGSADRVALAALGGAVGPYVYVASGTGQPIRRFDGTAWASPAGMPSATYVAVQPTDFRVVAAHTGGGRSRVEFSDAGAPETWTASSFVDLSPNDGEVIRDVCAFQNLLFVFKDSKFFVFYGNSEDSDGNPIFNYRTVDTGVGAYGVFAGRSTVATKDGVYFLSRSGVYRTTGGPPEKISAALDPLFQNGNVWFAGGQAVTDGAHGITTWNGRIVIATTLGTVGYVLLVYYPETQTWSMWHSDLDTAGFAALGRELLLPQQPSVLLFATGLSTHLYKVVAGTVTDNGTAIASRYRSSFYSPIGSPSQECKILESVLEGKGTPSFSVSHDYGAVPTTGGGAKTSVTLGTAPAYARGKHRKSQKGRRFSYQIEASSGAWQVNSIVQHVRSIRPPGIKST